MTVLFLICLAREPGKTLVGLFPAILDKKDELRAVLTSLSADAIFTMAVAVRAASSVRAVLAEVPATGAALFDQICNDGTIHGSLTAHVSDSIARFQRNRSSRDLATLLLCYAEGPLLTDATIDRIWHLAVNVEFDVSASQLDRIEASLRAEKPSPAIVGYIRNVATEAMGNSFIEPLVTRLENYQRLKAAVKCPGETFAGSELIISAMAENRR